MDAIQSEHREMAVVSRDPTGPNTLHSFFLEGFIISVNKK
jgi:hypothetical protein